MLPPHGTACGPVYPQCGTQKPCVGVAPQPPVAQAQPFGHCFELKHPVSPEQNTFCIQMHFDSTVTTQPHSHAPSQGWKVPQPPAAMQLVEGRASADAVPAVTIAPTPSAAPAPARLSNRPRVTRVSDTAISTVLLVSRSGRALLGRRLAGRWCAAATWEDVRAVVAAVRDAHPAGTAAGVRTAGPAGGTLPRVRARR